ncbi:GNAT family N-acetyltransferase [Cohnella panacarvi]|uniref:GNAT family N-acetyltransferase n=1 Tax=Cohnella panacarvi TaxID=400776 RepID=UPI00047B2004|nr:GNAT family protein [Cohnella panacarvi]
MFNHKVNEQIQLKLLEPRHADELYRLSDNNRKHLRQWLPWVDRTQSVEHTREYIQFAMNQYASNNGFQAGIFYQDQLVGCIGLHQIDWTNNKSSIGYWLAEAYQGKGIMSKACATVIHYLFDELRLNRVEIRAAVQNSKSRAIPERLNFTNEGLIRQAEWLYDHYVDHVVYGMLRDEWMKH